MHGHSFIFPSQLIVLQGGSITQSVKQNFMENVIYFCFLSPIPPSILFGFSKKQKTKKRKKRTKMKKKKVENKKKKKRDEKGEEEK